MKCYIIFIDRREDEGSLLGPYLKKESAVAGFKAYLKDHYGDDYEELVEQFGGNLDEVDFSTEEESFCLLERELLP